MSSAGIPGGSGALVREMGRWTLVALVLNSIIGSGIFGLPSLVAALLGSYSPLGFVIAAAGNAIIMVCFAEVASRFTAAGGAYLWVREALGRFLGIQIGWMSWLVRLTSCAAGANLFTVYLAEWFPRADDVVVRAAILAVLLGFLAAVNVRGVRSGARVSNFFTVAKLVPLGLFLVIGAAYLLTRGATTAPPPMQPSSAQWFEALLLLAFAYGGFESAMMPMAEARDPRRDAPFALLTAAAALTLLFTAIQAIVIYVLPDAAAAKRPLAAAAREMIGPAGALLMTAGAVISIYGFLSANILNTPRLTFALGERRDFPSVFAAVHPRFRTPWFSIVVFAVLVWALAIFGSFRWNAILSGVARLFVYGTVCLSLLALRRKHPGGAAFPLPFGRVLAVTGMLLTLVLVTRMGRYELYVVGFTIGLAGLTWLWARRRERGSG